MKSDESANLLEFLGKLVLNDPNVTNNFEQTFPPTQPNNPQFDVGSFMLTDKKSGRKFVCLLMVRECLLT